QGVQSVISVPMVYGGRLLGLLGFDSVRVEKKWPEDIIALLKIVGEMFVNALERKWADGQLKASLKEKELLLKEVHHRVKNNLQIMSSLLNLQSGYINDKQTLEMFKESQNRVKSMALIHEKLYESEGLTGIDFAEYIRNLTAYLFRLYEVNAKAISLKIDAEKVFLDVSTAISCGLILTELLSNALKYAFPAGREGEIFIDLRSHSNERIKLSVSDNGIGLPKDLDFRNTDSLGLQLVCALTDQLRGTIELERSAGTAFVITFGGLNPRQRD
ncbi:MAG: histidine kinase dimerization/phosphoacceptor domain -containing protein, partial [Acidiferrobacterales bacterium]